MKKIAIVVTNDLISDQRVHKVSLSLREAGWDVRLIGRVFRKLKNLERPYKVYRFRMFFRKGFLFYASYNIQLFFILLFSRYDCILSNDLDTLPASWLVSKCKRIPLVVDYHELFTEVPELVHRKIQRNIWLFFEKLMLPSAIYIYTVSQSIAEEIFFRYKKTVSVVRNVPFYNANELPLPKLFYDKKKIILYQGSLNVGRGIERAIESMKYINNSILVIIGSGDVEENLKDLAHFFNVSDKVVFIGRIPFEELLPYTVSAKIGLSIEEDRGLNYRYALPNKLFDYIQAGVPVVVSPLPEMKKIVEYYKFGKVCEMPDAFSLATLLNEMLADELSYNILKKNAMHGAKDLCWEEEKKVLDSMFSKLLSAV